MYYLMLVKISLNLLYFGLIYTKITIGLIYTKSQLEENTLAM